MLNDVPGVKLTKLSLLSARPGLAFAGCQLRRQHGEAGRERERSFACAADLELGQVGAGDASVAADVDDVDPF